MEKLQTLSRKVGTKFLEAGIFFTAFVPGSVLAQPDDLNTGIDHARATGATNDFVGIFQTIANTLLLILGAVAVIMLIVGGFRYVISGGDQSAVEGAKNTILYAIIGIVVAFLAYAAVDWVVDQLA